MTYSTLRKTCSLCMVGAIAATIAGFSQTQPTEAPTAPTVAVAPVVEPVVALGTTMPVQRTLTDTAGRKLDVTIFEKSATAIRARRTSDAKEFELPLDKLSVEDQAFIAGLVAAPAQKPTVLLIWEDKNLQEVLEKAGFATTIPAVEKRFEAPSGNPAQIAYDYPAVEKITDEELKKFNVIWMNDYVGHKQTDRFKSLVASGHTVMWKHDTMTSKTKFLAREHPGHVKKAPYSAYMKAYGNVVFYNSQTRVWDKKDEAYRDAEMHPEILDQVIAEAKKLMATQP